MLRLSKTLLFPSLIPSGEAQFKNLPGGSTNLYKLDWSQTDRIKENRLKGGPFCGTLPEVLKDWSDRRIFAITEAYLKEIRHYTLRSAEEWDRKSKLPDRSPAIAPAICYIQNAFHLLSDCIYDPETNYFSRSEEKFIAPFILSFRFWAYQTDPKNIKLYSNLSGLELVAQEKGDGLETGTFIALEEHLIRIIENSSKESRNEPRVITPGNLDDFIHNRKASSTIPNNDVLIPDIGMITLLSPVLNRSRGKCQISAEIACCEPEKILSKMISYSRPFPLVLTEGDRSLSTTASIKSISSTPPARIILNFSIDKGPDIDGPVGKIDKTKIEESRNEELSEAGITDFHYSEREG
jgi:hypothetical protein